MIQSQQQNKYLEAAVRTATPAQLLIMLYDGAIRFCKKGIDAIQKQDYQGAHTNLVKVQDIIMEFAITLDRSVSLSEDLLRLYDYFLLRLAEANSKKNVEPIHEVVSHLMELREAWVKAAMVVANTPAVAGADHG
jgi:flagellar protein FliS